MKLFYRKTGSGRPLIILHGLYGSSDNWMSVAKSLSGHFEVWLPDLRNHGRSPHDRNHTYEMIRNDILEFIDDAGIEKPVIIGHSMGGKAAMCFAQHHPDRIEKLIVADIAPKSYKDLYREEPLNHHDILQAMKKADVSSAGTRRDVDDMLQATIKSARIRGFLMKNLDRGDDGSYRWTLNLDVLIKELDNIMDGVNSDCFDPEFPLTGFPVLFIRGGKSAYVLDEDIEVIERIFPSAKIVTINGAGHWLHAEQPAAFVEAVLEFTAV
ncbi:MAG: alpha/beta fold hydrolase [Marinilabiliales bacterium]|nr:MAG: alpha/beta fold hydrolase [Marinilabiliales bacterium]